VEDLRGRGVATDLYTAWADIHQFSRAMLSARVPERDWNIEREPRVAALFVEFSTSFQATAAFSISGDLGFFMSSQSPQTDVDLRASVDQMICMLPDTVLILPHTDVQLTVVHKLVPVSPDQNVSMP
jgi:hypothetical protein